MDPEYPFMCSDEELLLRNEKWENMLKKYNHSLYHDEAACERTVTEWESLGMRNSEPKDRPEVYSMTTRSRCNSRLMEEQEPERSPRREKSRGENQSSSLVRDEESVDEENYIDENEDEENLSRREVTTEFQRKDATSRREKWIVFSKEITLEDEDNLLRKEEKEVQRDKNSRRRDRPKSRGNALRETNATVDKEMSDSMEEEREKEGVEKENVADGAGQESLAQADWIYNNICDKQPVLLDTKQSQVRTWLMGTPHPASCSDIPSRVRGLRRHTHTDSESFSSEPVSGSSPGTVSVSSPEPVRPLSQEPVGVASRELLSASSPEQPVCDGSSQVSTVLASPTCPAQPALLPRSSKSRLVSKRLPRDRDALPPDVSMVFQSTDDAGDLSCTPIDLSCRPYDLSCRPDNLSYRPTSVSCRPDNLSGRPHDLNCRPDDLNCRPDNLSCQPVDFSCRLLPVLLETVDTHFNLCKEMNGDRAKGKHSSTEMENAEDLTLNVQRDDGLWSARVEDCQVDRTVRLNAECHDRLINAMVEDCHVAKTSQLDAECAERLPSATVVDCQVVEAVQLDAECKQLISATVVDCPVVETPRLDAECDERQASVREECQVVDESQLHATKMTSERSKVLRTVRGSNTPLWIARTMQTRKRKRNGVTDKSRERRETDYRTVRTESSADVASRPTLDKHSVASGGDIVIQVVEEGTLQRRMPDEDSRKKKPEVLSMPSDSETVLESSVAWQQATSHPNRDSSRERKGERPAGRKETNVSNELSMMVKMDLSSIVTMEMEIVTDSDEEILLSNTGRRKKSASKKSIEKGNRWANTKGTNSTDRPTKGKDSTDQPAKGKDSTDRPAKGKDSTDRTAKGKDSTADLENTPLTSRNRGTRQGERKNASGLNVQSNADKKSLSCPHPIVFGVETSPTETVGQNETAVEVTVTSSRSSTERLDGSVDISTGAGKLEDSRDPPGLIGHSPATVSAAVTGRHVSGLPRRRKKCSTLETRGRKTGEVTPAKMKRQIGLRSSVSPSSQEESKSMVTGKTETNEIRDFHKVSIGCRKAATSKCGVTVKTGTGKSSTGTPAVLLEIASDSDGELTSPFFRQSSNRRAMISSASLAKRVCKPYGAMEDDDSVNGDGREMEPRERRTVVSTKSGRKIERVTPTKVKRQNELTSPHRDSLKKNGRFSAGEGTEAPVSPSARYDAWGTAGERKARKSCWRSIIPGEDVDRVAKLPGGGMIFMSDVDMKSDVFDKWLKS